MKDRSGHGGRVTTDGLGDLSWSRRRWLKGTALLWPAVSAVAGAQTARDALRPADEQVVATVRARAEMAGLTDLSVKVSDHFLGVGNASPQFCGEALSLCESVARDFLAHFGGQAFKLDFPAQRMTVVTLKDSKSYQAYSQEPADESVGGHYDTQYNQLVMFDFRPGQAKLAAEAKRVNTFALVHETIHLVTYNTGLLSRMTDVPAVVSEGLATYGELWKPPRDAKAFGTVNTPRLEALVQALGNGQAWMRVSRLIADDEVFRSDEEQIVQLAYAEAWLLVHALMKTEGRLPKFRQYLAAMPKPGGANGREAYAAKQLGPLGELDVAVRRHAQLVARRAGLRLPASLSRARG